MPGSANAVWSEENGSVEGTISGARYHTGAGHSQRSPWSTCGSSSVADGLEDLADEFANIVALKRLSHSEFRGDTGTVDEAEKLRVCLLGHFGVGKTALVGQFMTSDYTNTYDDSIGKYI